MCLGDLAAFPVRGLGHLPTVRFFSILALERVSAAWATFLRSRKPRLCTQRYARRTKLLHRLLELMALAMAGRAASRLLERLGVRVGRDTLIGLVRALPDPESERYAAVQELAAKGWTISAIARKLRLDRHTTRKYLRPFRSAATAAHTPSPAPTVREVTRWITSHPDHLTTNDQARLTDLRSRSPAWTPPPATSPPSRP